MKKTSIETYKKAYVKSRYNKEMTFEKYLEFCERRLKRARKLGLLI